MIKVNELRIGNRVYCEGREIIVDAISEEKIRFKNTKGTFYVDPENINPISLTTEKLENCGFKLDGGGKFELNNVEIWNINNKLNCALNPYLWVTLYSLHQLQNLYFALTGKKLVFHPK
jgi:hypothetical protein